ncbi:MAG: hypothetical protein ACJ8GN_02165 [Longimicrobiaceae bacterium]
MRTFAEVDPDDLNWEDAVQEVRRLRDIEAAARALVDGWDNKTVSATSVEVLVEQLRSVLEGRASSSPPAGGGDPPG